MEESIEMIKISRDLFQIKLNAIKKEIADETNKKNREKLMLKAEKLYKEYKESLQLIKEYMNKIYQKAKTEFINK